MHAIHPDLRRLLAAACAALVLTVAALVLAPAAGDLDLHLGGGSHVASPPPAAPAQTEASPPRWLVAPLSPPAFPDR